MLINQLPTKIVWRTNVIKKRVKILKDNKTTAFTSPNTSNFPLFQVIFTWGCSLTAEDEAHVLLIESYQRKLESQFPPRSQQLLPNIPNFTQYRWCKDIFLPEWYFFLSLSKQHPSGNRMRIAFMSS